MTFGRMWTELATIGRSPDTGGYLRGGWSAAALEAEAWFVGECAARELVVESDTIGNLVAWWQPEDATGDRGVLTGSHLDSVPHGGAFDGPLGVVSALAAVDQLRARGFAPSRPLGLVVWVEEEGSRFGRPCLGSRLATGAFAPDLALGLRDRDGVSLSDAYAAAGFGIDPKTFGHSDLPGKAGVFVELHVEQGRWLAEADGGTAVGVASSIWPHGRWRMEFSGRADHAGTTRMQDRADPMVTAAFAALAANKQARSVGARATVGRLELDPGATNAIPGRVRAWIDARASDQATLDALLGALAVQVGERADRDGTSVDLVQESMSPVVRFDAGLRDRVAAAVGAATGDGSLAPALPTAAGHDAGILAAAGVPTAMIFVRNPTGVSHSPAEHADADDCESGVVALAAVLEDLAGPGALA